jgi:hypothetical protein
LRLLRRPAAVVAAVAASADVSRAIEPDDACWFVAFGRLDGAARLVAWENEDRKRKKRVQTG